jgi:signal transduction histidine kinase
MQQPQNGHNVPAVENLLFRKLPPGTLASAGISFEVETFEPGEAIFAEGDAADCCYLVETGAVRLTKTSSGGAEELLAVAAPGSFFGEFALYDDAPRSAHARAAVSSRLTRLDRGGFERLCRLAPLEMMSTLAEVNIARVREGNDFLIRNLAQAGRLKDIGGELSTVAHNLRGPLATIRNAADVLAMLGEESGAEVGQFEGFVHIIQNTADGALSDIDRLMARLRGESAERTAVHVRDLLEEVRAQVVGVVGRNGVEYDDDGIEYEGTVLVERPEWVGALVNLVKNAVEALPAGRGLVSVSVREEGGEVVFAVEDSGSGVPAEVLARFFDRGVTYGKSGGTGLGTAHVRSVAESHGGRAEVRSETGVGTIVEMRLPLQFP